MIFFERWPCQRIDLQEEEEWIPAVSWLRITKRQSMVIEVTVKPKRKDRRTKCGEFIFGVETPVCVSPADQRLSRRFASPTIRVSISHMRAANCVRSNLIPSISEQLPLFSSLSLESTRWITMMDSMSGDLIRGSGISLLIYINCEWRMISLKTGNKKGEWRENIESKKSLWIACDPLNF